MMNESLCSEDYLRQAHLSQVDFFIKRLFSFSRLPVDVFEKLMTLREEDGSQNGLNGADQFMQGESNFFLDEPPASNGLDLALKEGEGYDEVEAVNKKHQGEDETMEEGNEEEEEKEEIDPGKAQRMFDEIFDCSTLSKDELEQRKKRY